MPFAGGGGGDLPNHEHSNSSYARAHRGGYVAWEVFIEPNGAGGPEECENDFGSPCSHPQGYDSWKRNYRTNYHIPRLGGADVGHQWFVGYEQIFCCCASYTVSTRFTNFVRPTKI